MIYECIIIGGGIAGLQAAIQLGRYQRKVLVVDSNQGRSNLCRSYHNLLGWPEGVSGEHLRRVGRIQAERHGIEFKMDEIVKAKKTNTHFELQGKTGEVLKTKSLLLATGVTDRIPEELRPKLLPCLGLTVYVCPDCDGIETKGKPTVVMGSGNTGANLALTLLNWTKQIVYINHEDAPIEQNLTQQLEQQNIPYFSQAIVEIITEENFKIKGVRLKDETFVPAERGFIAFGGNEVHSSLAAQLGVERLENKHLLVDPRTKQTNIPMVWAAGDVVAHSEQVAIAMGEGIQAAIWIHKKLPK